MIRQWKRFIPLVLSGGLVACGTLPVQDSKLETTEGAETITHPQLEMPAPVAVVTPDQQYLKKLSVSQYRMMGDGKLILGQREWVFIPGIDKVFKARIEPDDDMSSLNVVDLQYFQRNGQDWATFRVAFHSQESDIISLPVVYWMTSKPSSGTKLPERRAVVMTWIEVGGIKERTTFTLDNRSHLSYPVLLGHSFLKDQAVVDLEREYIQKKPSVLPSTAPAQ